MSVDWRSFLSASGWSDGVVVLVVVLAFVLALRPSRIRVLPDRERGPWWKRWW